MCGCLTKFGEILHEAYVYREKKYVFFVGKDRHKRKQT